MKNVESHSLHTNFHTYNEYTLKKGINVYYKFDYLNKSIQYIDENLSTNSDFYDNILLDTITTLDTFNLKSYENNFGIKGSLSSVYYNFFFKRYDIKSLYLTNGFKRKKSENILGSNIRFNKNSFLINIDALLKQNGNYILKGTIRNNIFDLNYLSGLFNPTIIENYHYGNHFSWDENFKSKFVNQFKGKFNFSNKYLEINPEIKLTSIKNYIYFNESKLPVQHENMLYYYNYIFSFKVNFLKNHIHFHNNMVYTLVSGNESNNIFRMPKYNYYGKLYYTDTWFDNKIPIELGLNLYYRSSYYGNAYNPIIQQFHIQNHFKLKSYFVSNVYFNIKIENLRVFVKMNHFNQFESLDGYFVTPYYPGQRRVLDFGIRWLFFN